MAPQQSRCFLRLMILTGPQGRILSFLSDGKSETCGRFRFPDPFLRRLLTFHVKRGGLKTYIIQWVTHLRSCKFDFALSWGFNAYWTRAACATFLCCARGRVLWGRTWRG